MILRILFGLAFFALFAGALETLAFRAFWKAYRGMSWWPQAKLIWWIVQGTIWALFISAMVLWPSLRADHPSLLKGIVALMFVVTIPKIVIGCVQLLDEAWALVQWGSAKFSKQSSEGIWSRGSFLNVAAQSSGAIALLGMGYGVRWGKYNYQVRQELIKHPNVPRAFAGLRIVQLSDAHLGSFDGTPDPVLRAIDRVNELEPDLVLFTGDLVNHLAEEAEPWVEPFSKIRAPLGKFSIMGNHDYADYGRFSEEERKASIEQLHDIHRRMGFTMLNNDHVMMEKDGECLVLAGVENWGVGFRQSGDLNQALAGSDANNEFTVLLSHDPTHFESQVMKGKAPVELTLSGHTHGMQIGIQIPWLGVDWSPSSFRYKRWGGLYLEGDQYLHVNRGFGVLGFPGRVGMPPEITVLTLAQGAPEA